MVPLKKDDIVDHVDALLPSNTYLIVFINSLVTNSIEPEIDEIQQPTKDLARTYTKVTGEESIISKLMLCPFSYCLKHLYQ